MKKDNLIWWLVGGIAAYALYRYYQNKNSAKLTKANLVGEVLIEEETKFPQPLLAQYNIVLPVDMVNKKVQAKADKLRAGRFALQPQRINKPVTL